MSAPVHFASDPITIGRHEWRVIVTDSKFSGRRFAYQFRAIGELPIWLDFQSWPRFDWHAPGMGLPATLARLFDANHDAIQAALRLPAAISPPRITVDIAASTV